MDTEQDTDDPKTMILQKCVVKPHKGNNPSFPTGIISVTVNSFNYIITT